MNIFLKLYAPGQYFMQKT